MKENFEVIIVGAGPGGISLAAELISGGMSTEDIVVLEKSNKESWVMRKLYAEQKLVTANYKGITVENKSVMDFYDMSKPDALKALNDTIEKYQINVLFETEVSKIEKIDERFVHLTSAGTLYSQFSAIGIGIFGRPNKPSYKIPSGVKKLVEFDITSSVIENAKVLIVGAGDSAAEYVQFLADKNEVYMASRNPDGNRMNERNYEITQQLISEKKLTMLEPCNIVALEEVRDVESGELLPKVKVKFAEDELSDDLFDRVIYAIGGTTPINFLKITGMEFDGKTPVMDDNHESSVKNLFLAGDLGNGLKGGSIILAFNTSHNIAQVILARSKKL